MKDNDLEIAQCNQDGIFSESERPQTRKALAIGNVIWTQVDNGTWWRAQVLKLHNYNRKDVFLKSLAKELSLLNSEDDKASDVTVSLECTLFLSAHIGEQHLSDNINTNGDLRTPKRSKIWTNLGKYIYLSNQPTERSRPTKMMQMVGHVAPTDSPSARMEPNVPFHFSYKLKLKQSICKKMHYRVE